MAKSEKKTGMKMDWRKPISKEAEAGMRAAAKDLDYDYAFAINKREMMDYQYLCKMGETSASKELRQFIAKQLDAYPQMFPHRPSKNH
jgi:deoxyribodipyrimidine photolyase